MAPANHQTDMLFPAFEAIAKAKMAAMPVPRNICPTKRLRRISGSDASFTWVSEEFLVENGVEAWDGLPYWLGIGRFVAQTDVSKALAAGLELRPLEQTVRDTFTWDRTRRAPSSFGRASRTSARPSFSEPMLCRTGYLR